MEFSIVEKRDNDRFVLYDMQNKGKACASKYTIKQLINNKHIVHGYSDKGIVICSTTGTPVKRKIKYNDIPDTKRSTVTFEAGIKPSRAEKKANKTKANKRKENIKEKQAAAEKERKYLEITKKKRFISKPLFELIKEELWGAEYDEGGEYIYQVRINTPAAQAIVNKMVKTGVIRPYDFSEKISDGDKIISEGPIHEELYKCQVIASNHVHLSFENYYTSESVSCDFYASEHFEFLPKNASFYHSDEKIMIGSVADGGSSLKNEGIWLRKKMGIIG